MIKNQMTEAAVFRIVRHMASLQQQVTGTPSTDNADDDEVGQAVHLLFQYTPSSIYPLPSKSMMERVIYLLRGGEDQHYAYISSRALAQVIRRLANDPDFARSHDLTVLLCKDAEAMDDEELYKKGLWNYKPSPLWDLLWEMAANPHRFQPDGRRR